MNAGKNDVLCVTWKLCQTIACTCSMVTCFLRVINVREARSKMSPCRCHPDVWTLWLVFPLVSDVGNTSSQRDIHRHTALSFSIPFLPPISLFSYLHLIFFLFLCVNWHILNNDVEYVSILVHVLWITTEIVFKMIHLLWNHSSYSLKIRLYNIYITHSSL